MRASAAKLIPHLAKQRSFGINLGIRGEHDGLVPIAIQIKAAQHSSADLFVQAPQQSVHYQRGNRLNQPPQRLVTGQEPDLLLSGRGIRVIPSEPFTTMPDQLTLPQIPGEFQTAKLMSSVGDFQPNIMI